MRRIVLCLSLLLALLSFPERAKAWDFTGNTNPYRVVVHFDDPVANEFTRDMNYDSTNKMWTLWFTARQTTTSFRIEAFWGTAQNPGGSSYIGNDGIYYDVNTQTDWQWFEEKYPDATSAPRLRISNLKVGASYRIDFSDNGLPEDNPDTKWNCYKVTKVYDNFFLYTGVSAEAVKQVAEGINTDGTFVFYAKGLTKDQTLYLSRTGGQTTWSGMQYNDARFTPNTVQNIPGTGIQFGPFYANKKEWKTTADGNYVITVDWANQKLSAFNQVHLYTFKDAQYNLTKLGTSAINANDCACFEVDLEANQNLFLSTNDVTNLDPLNNNGGRIAPSTGSDVNAPVKDNAIRFNASSGSWKVTEAGRYIITLDMSKNSFSAVKVSKLYLYKKASEVEQIKEITLDNSLKSTFPVTIADNQYLFLSTNAGATTWAGLAQYNGRLNPDNVDTELPKLNTSFVINTGGNGSWHVASGGNYVFTVDYAAKTLSAVKTVYLYEYNPADQKVTKVGSGTFGANGTTTNIYTDLTAGRYLMLSSTDGVTKMDGFGSDRFNPYDQDISIPAENTSFAIHEAGKKGSWYVSKTGRYAITIDWAAQKLSASSTIYLYRNRDEGASTTGWKTIIGASEGGLNGKYTFTAYLQANDFIVLSQKANGTGWGDISPLNWSPGSDKDIVSNEVTNFAQNSSGAWKATKAGRYSITVDWTAKTFVATEIMVDMPLTSADFAGNKKHYFLVGERLGEWHLQPEWEFKEQANGQYVLNNRYIYNGGFAVGVVDNYEDYITHKFKYYSTKVDFTPTTLSSSAMGSGNVYQVFKGNTRYNPADCFYAKFDGPDAYYSGYGTYMSTITLSLSSGTPTGITFTKGSDTDAAKQRVFSLVGDKILNNNYNNVPGYATTMQNRDRGGWMDSWVQYNKATKKPYVDGNGEYLYHTSFTPDYLTANPVPFNITLDSGKEFAYTSSNIQFVEYSNLNNLDTDPYKDFYKAFSGTQKISNNGETKAGTGYNFKVKVACNNPTTEPTANWSCYVIRDVWIAGQIKFWSGWGGNTDWTDGGTNGYAVWHGPNGGPDITENTNYDVKGYDINSGLEAYLYKNIERRGNTNYKVSDGKPVYFNRVILWYNNADGVSKSYIQFIQESAGPAIFAQVTTNTTTSKSNWIKSNWYLNKSQQTGGDNALVKSYEIRRYRIVDGKSIDTGVVKSADISSRNIKVSQLYEASAPSLADITTFTDTGMGEGDTSGFTPGLYEYVITVTDAFGGTKKATSNRVAIYDDSMVSPDAVPMQLVELRDAYTDAFGTSHAAASSVLGTNKRYLTYRTNDNDNFYVMNITGSGTSAQPAEAELIDAQKAIAFLKNHPDKYFWTSDYYVRCLDYDQYKATLQTYIDNAIIKEAEVPTPTVTVSDIYTAEGGGTVTRDRGTATLFTFGDKNYYSAVVKRGGNLANATLKVDLSYTYTKSDGNKTTATSSATTQISPVMPMPRDPKYRYVYSQPENTASFGSNQWGKINVPAFNWESGNTTKDVYVKLDDNFDPRQLDLQIDFTRPNVNSEIYRNYNITYALNVANDNTGLAPSEQVDLAINGQIVDTATSGTDNRYRYEIKGMNARDEIVPTVKITSTTYTPIAESVNNEVYGTQVASYGEAISFNAPHAIEAGYSPEGLKNVHLGKVQRNDGKWDWMYKGHESFSDEPAKLERAEVEEKYEDASAYSSTSIEPRYYLIEVRGLGTDKATYSFLVPHIANHRDEGKIETSWWGLILNDSDPLIGTYIAEDFTNETTPTIYATAIYIFKRQLDGNSSGTYTNYTPLTVQSFKVNGTETATSGASLAPARIKGNYTNDELINNGVGDLPKTSDIPTANVVDLGATNSITGYGSSVVKGFTYQTTNSELVTGAENIGVDESGEAVYYNLRGMRIDRPTSTGVYIRVTPTGVEKVVIK